MILPNKLISFQDCILAKTVYILEKISDSDFSVIGLYEQVETHFEDLNEYMLALDVLYVLGKIKYNEGLQVIVIPKQINILIIFLLDFVVQSLG